MKNQHDLGRRDGDFILSKPTEIENELPFQLIGAGCDFYQYSIERPFGFPVFQWIQTIRGIGVLEDRGKTHRVEPGQGMLLYPGQPHSYYGMEDPWYVHWITFSGNSAESMLHYLGMTETGVYQLSHPNAVETLIRRALQTLGSNALMRGIDGSAIVYSLLLDFLKYLERDGEDSHIGSIHRLQPALDLIEKELHRPLGLEDLARSIDVTPQYFCELFKSVTTQRPVEYINQRRIDRAKERLLKEPHARIHDIAAGVGFESDSYFGTVFKRFEGISPREYRETNGAS